jgi:hypothetical protein
MANPEAILGPWGLDERILGRVTHREPIGTEMSASLYKCVGVTWTKNLLLGHVIAAD